MAALGRLVVSIALEYAQFTAGVKKSEQDALAFAKSVQDGMDKAGQATRDFLGGVVTGALAAVASYQTVTAVIDGVKASIDRLDNISKAAARFGIAGEELERLAYAGELSDVSLDTLGTSVKKLSVNLLEAATGSKEQAQLFRAMNVEVKNADGSVRNAADVLGDLADVFAGLPDGATKTALAVQLLGKSGADMIPFLNGGKKALQEAGDEAVRFGLVTSNEAKKGAEAFNDNLTRLGKISEGVFSSLASQALPTLVSVTNSLVGTAAAMSETNREAVALSANNGLQAFLETSLIAAATLGEALFAVGKTIRAVGGSFESVAADVQAAWTIARAGPGAIGEAITNGTGVVADALANRNKVAAEANARYVDLWNYNGTAVSDAIRRSYSAEAKAIAAFQTDPRELARRGRPAGGGGGADTAQAEALRKLLEGMNKASGGARALRDDYSDLTKSIDERIAAMQAEAEAGRALTEVEKLQSKLIQEIDSGTRQLTVDQMVEVDAKLQQALAIEQTNLARAAEAKFIKAHEEAQKSYLATLGKTNDGIDAQAEKERMAIVAIVGGAEAVEMLEVAKLRDQQATALRNEEIERGIDGDQRAADAYGKQAEKLGELIALRTQRVGLEGEKQRLAELEAMTSESAKRRAEEEERLAQQVGQSLTDQLMEGGRNGLEYIKGIFRSTVLRPIVQAVANPIAAAVTGGLGFAGNAAAATGGGGLGGIGSVLSNITSGIGSTLGSALSAAGNLFGSSALSSFATGLQGNSLAAGLAGPTTAGAGGALGAGASLASAVPYIAAAVALFSAKDALFGRKLKDTSIEGTFGGAAGFEGDSTKFYKGGLFRSNKTERTALGADLVNPLAESVVAIRGQVEAYAKALGLPVDALASYTQEIKFSTKDLSPEQIQAKLKEALGAFSEGLAGTLSESVNPFAEAGETASQTLARLAGSLQGVNPILEQLGLSLLNVSAAGGGAAADLVKLFGGVDKLGAAAGDYYGKFYTEAERSQRVADQLGKAFADLNVTAPTTREEFRALVEAQDLTSESGRETFAALLQVSGAFSDLQVAGDDAAQSVKDAADALREQLASAVTATADKFRNPEQRTASAYAGISASLQGVGLNFSVDDLLGATKEQIGAFFEAFTESTDNTDEAKLAVTQAASALADLKDQAADAAQEVERAATELRESVAQALDGVIADFLAGSDLASYRAERIAGQLRSNGIDASAGGVLGATKQDIVDLWYSVGDESKLVIASLYDDWVTLQQGIAQSNVDDYVAGLGVSADELRSAYEEINPAADNLIEAWRRGKTEAESLAQALQEIDGTGAVSALDALKGAIANRDGLRNVVGGIDNKIFDLKVGQGGTQAVDLLKKREAELWRKFASTNSPEVAQAITDATLQRIQLEASLQEEANAAKIDALNEQISAAERLKDIAADMGQFVLSLKAGSLSNLSYGGRLDAQKQLFDTAISTGGDVQGQAQAYLQQAQQVYGGSTAEYSAIFEQVTAQLEALGLTGGTEADGQIAAAQAQIDALTSLNDSSAAQINALDELRNTFGSSVDTQTAAIAEQTGVLREQLTTMQQQVANQELQITQMGEGLQRLIDAQEAIAGTLSTRTRDEEMAAAAA